jgi:hypothetical protein
MDRDMSYDLDAAFSTRMSGELQRETITRSRAIRTPGLHVIEQAELYKPINDNPRYKNLGHGIARPSRDMAGFLDDDVTLFGQQVAVKHIAIGGVAALAVWYCFFRKKHA